MDGSSSQHSMMVSALANYKFGKTLGTGASAKVKLALHVPTRQKVAIKIFSRKQFKTKNIEEKVQREIKILKSLSHPHIIRQYEIIETATHIYVVMEYFPRELFDYIVQEGRLPEDEACHIFQQIISGVEYCHHNRIVHRDLKPENVLIDSKKNIKIVDFGLSNIMQDGHLLKTTCGSPNYIAPEVFAKQPYYGSEVDIWSCGVILYALLCGTLPFDDPNVPNIIRKIKSGVYTLPGHLSCEVRDLISRLLVVDPMMRIGISEIRQHPWFKSHLPHHLLVPPVNITEQDIKINEEIVQKVITMGFNRNHLIESLGSKIQNNATVTYHLMQDTQSKSKAKQIADATFNSRISFEVVTLKVDHPFASLSQTTFERRWSLGLHSQGSPEAIMDEVSKALQNLKVDLRKMEPYNIRCKWVPSFANNKTHKDIFPCSSLMNVAGCAINSSTIIKFELKLCQVSEGGYVVDIQKVYGPQFLFFYLSIDLLTELGVI